MLDGTGEALALFLHVDVLLVLILGTAVGVVVAMLPGIGAPVTMALLLPLTFTMERETALMFLVTIMGAGGFAGSITGILMRVPGDSNVASMLDGYPLARQGRGSEAIGATIAASTLGAIFGIVLLVTSLPVLQQAVLLFGPPELFVAAAAGVLLVATVSPGAVGKGIIAGLAGMVLGTFGHNLVTGEVRYDFGYVYLYEGIPLVPAIAGLFALPEMVALMRRNRAVSLTGTLVPGGLWRGCRQVVARPLLLAKSSTIGAVVGIVPGVGSSVGTWVAYYAAMKSSRDPESFGKGNIEGVIAPEASRDAREGASMIPLLALGIPGGLATAVLLSAFLIHGVTPGRRLFEQDMPLVWAMILALLFANVVTGILGLAAANQMAKVTLVPARILVPIILVTAFIGSYVDTGSSFGMVALVAFGLLGLAMEHLRYPRPPLLLGLILLPIAENNFFVSGQIYDGSYAYLLRPPTLTIIVLTLLAVLGPKTYRRLRPRRSIPGAPVSRASDGDALAHRPVRAELVSYAVIVAVSIPLAVMATGFSSRARAFPLIVLTILILTAVTAAIALALANRQAREPADAHSAGRLDAGAHGGEEQDRPFARTAPWIVLLPVLIWLLGMLPAIFVYVAAFIGFFERRPLSVRNVLIPVLSGLAVVLIVDYLFSNVLGVRFPAGLILPFEGKVLS
jgi:putative tricarboxylic transport membrane protein